MCLWQKKFFIDAHEIPRHLRRPHPLHLPLSNYTCNDGVAGVEEYAEGADDQ